MLFNFNFFLRAKKSYPSVRTLKLALFDYGGVFILFCFVSLQLMIYTKCYWQCLEYNQSSFPSGDPE